MTDTKEGLFKDVTEETPNKIYKTDRSNKKIVTQSNISCFTTCEHFLDVPNISFLTRRHVL